MLLDGNIVDMATIAVGAIVAISSPLRRYKNKIRPCFKREIVIIDFLNGVMLVPFSMMAFSVFSSVFMDELLKTAKITLAIGGLSGLFFVLGEILKDKNFE